MSKDAALARMAKDHGALETLVRHWQEAHGLTVDGWPGPVTLASIRGAVTPAEPVSELGPAVLAVAIGQLGQGEVAGDNRGPVVAMYQGVDDGGGDLGSWCAGFMSWCIEQGAFAQGRPSPVARSSWARTLFARCRRAGRAVDIPDPGDIVLFERGEAGGSSHIGIVDTIVDTSRTGFWSIEGNVGRPPAKVKRVHHRLDDDRIIGYARLP